MFLTENKMLGLDTAKKLHEMGIECNYRNGDYVYRHYKHGYRLHLIADWTEDDAWDDDLPAPSLDQLLTKIEQKGYSYILRPIIAQTNDKRDTARIVGYHVESGVIKNFSDESPYFRKDCFDVSKAEAASSTLIWVLEQVV